MGGFVDGIVLHQLLQWHHMASSIEPTTTVAGLEANAVADGLFHAGSWLLVAAGLGLLWRNSRVGHRVVADRAFVGWLIIGWGLFDLADEVISTRFWASTTSAKGDNELAYDIAFLALEIVQVIAGWLLACSAARARA